MFFSIGFSENDHEAENTDDVVQSPRKNDSGAAEHHQIWQVGKYRTRMKHFHLRFEQHLLSLIN